MLSTNSPRLIAAILVAGAWLGFVAPASAADLICQFRNKGMSMSFGVLNPASGVDVIKPVSGGTTAGDCTRVTMTISGDNGLNYNGSRNLKSSAGDLIAYSLVGLPQSSPSPGNSKYVAFTFDGAIFWNDYANSPAGNYSDTVIISVSP